MILLKILGFLIGIVLVGIGGFKLIVGFLDYLMVILSVMLWSGILAAGLWLLGMCFA